MIDFIINFSKNIIVVDAFWYKSFADFPHD